MGWRRCVRCLDEHGRGRQRLFLRKQHVQLPLLAQFQRCSSIDIGVGFRMQLIVQSAFAAAAVVEGCWQMRDWRKRMKRHLSFLQLAVVVVQCVNGQNLSFLHLFRLHGRQCADGRLWDAHGVESWNETQWRSDSSCMGMRLSALIRVQLSRVPSPRIRPREPRWQSPAD
jgi:hypothetical protein